MCIPACKACGQGCGNVCSNCGKCMDGCCKCFGTCCEDFCAAMTDIFCGERPFPLFSCFTFFLQGVPGLVFAILGLAGLADCGLVPIFLILSGVFMIGNFLMSAYFYWRVSMDTEKKESFAGRGAKVLCYDPCLCIYGLLFIPGHLVITILLIVFYSSEGGTDCGVAGIGALIAIILYFVYMAGGVVVAFCSCCCQSVKEGVSQINKAGSK